MATQDGPLDDQRREAKDREASVAGSLSDMGVADLVQTLELGRKSGVLHLRARTGARATCHFRQGRVVDCELGELQGEEAFYRILRWHEGGFAIEFKPIEREERIQLPTQALLLQGMRRMDEWGRVIEQLPPLDRRLEVDVARLGERLSKIPDGANALVRLFDGRRTLAQVLEDAPGDDLAAADTVARLLADGILTEQGATASAPAAQPAAGTRAATEPEPSLPAPEQGGVDWFAGPVGSEGAVAPAASWALTPGEAGPARPGPAERGSDWLEPPHRTPPPAVAVPPATAPRTSPPRSSGRFSIPLPPPGSLPPPPSVAETLARYRVVPRPIAPTVTEPAPDASPEPDRLGAAPAAPEPARPAAPAPAPARTEPAAAEPPEARPAARPGGKSIRERLEPGALPLHLEERPEVSRPPAAPKRSAVPYLAVGALVIAALAGGAVLLRRPPLDERSPVAPAAPEEARPPPVDAAPTARVQAPADEPRPAPSAPSAATTPVEQAPRAERPAAPAAEAPPSAPATEVAPIPVAASAPAGTTAAAGEAAAAAAPRADDGEARRLLAAADRKYSAGRYAEAIADYRRALDLRPTPAARVALARALYDAHRDADAMRELDQVLEANPRDASAWLLRGDLHQGEGRTDQARDAYRRFLELEPKGEQARVVRMILGRDPQ